ncbi:MAG: O-antigen ligase domain-containing protein, partial [Aestuariivirga sp.]
LTPSRALRLRIIVMTVLGTAGAGALLAALLSIPDVYELFLDRFTLVKYYDAGETGRFGNQLNSIPILLQRPLGFGPTYFRQIFRMDPHNVYLNAFSSYGWLGGISYFLLIISTIIVGLKAVFTRTPWQHLSVVVFCPLLTTMLQGIQIDTDHWRHFYWLTGMMWGLYAATAAWRPSPQQPPP